MVKLSEIRALIDAYIKTNGNQEITGHTMNVLLNEIVRILDERKQDVLVSGKNIKTIGGMSLLGEGDIPGYDDTEIRNLLNAVVAAVEGQNGKIAEVAGSVQEQDKKLTEKEDKKNKVTKLTEGATDVQYPSAKAVYDLIIWLMERLEEQDQFIEDLYNNTIPKNADDYYPDISVGVADNLAGVDVVDSEINFRRSGGGAITDGVARIESIKGNSVVWNQLAKKRVKSASAAGLTAEWEGDYIRVTGTYTKEGDLNIYSVIESVQNVAQNQSFAVISDNSKIALYVYGAVSGTIATGAIVKTNANGKMDINLRPMAAVEVGTTINEIVRPKITNLTQMFGAGNEPTTIEEFYQRIPMGVDLNAYNEGEVIHMDVQSIVSQGVNAWDGVLASGRINSSNGEVNTAYKTEAHSPNFIRIIGGASYYARVDNIPNTNYYVYLYAYFYDENLAYIGTNKIEDVRNATFSTPTNAKYMRFHLYSSISTGIPLDYKGICINISDTSINGKYFPYIKRVEDLAVIRKYFPDGMKSAGSAHDEIRYNKASGKKVYSKGRLKSVDMGSLNWEYMAANQYFFISNAEVERIGMAYNGVTTRPSNVIALPYTSAPTYNTEGLDKVMTGPYSNAYSGRFMIKDTAYTDVASFKAAMQGVILYYEAAEWEWVELDEADQFKDLDYQVWNGGTEKANAEGKSAPLAADITYGFNAIGKIKELESLVAALRAKVGI